MNHRLFTLSMLASWLLLISGSVQASPTQESQNHAAMMTRSTESTNRFRRLDQPLWSKVVVTGAGLGLIGLELWWFLLSKPSWNGTEEET